MRAEAAEAFGKGREIDFHPRGAREVRQAGGPATGPETLLDESISEDGNVEHLYQKNLSSGTYRLRLSLPGGPLALLLPTPQLTDIPISDEAKRYYDNGPSFLRRIFPFSVANFLERAWVLAIPLITLVITPLALEIGRAHV